MKFRSKTGEVFENTYEDVTFCGPYKGCIGCPVGNIKQNYDCTEWVNNHPHEATRLMGFKVVEEDEKCATCANQKTVECVTCGALYRNYQEKETDMDKPRICEVLGVEVGERFELGNTGIILMVNDDGLIHTGLSHGDHKETDMNVNYLVKAINDPDRIIRKPRFTEKEVERAKAIKVLWPETNAIKSDGAWTILLVVEDDTSWQRETVPESFFPSAEKNEVYTIDEIIGGAE